MACSSPLNIWALAALTASAITAHALAEEAPTDVNAEIKEVKTLLEQVHAQELALQKRQEALEQKQEEQAALNQSLEDARRHSELADLSGISGGFVSGRGFYVASNDGRFLIHPWALFQFRNETAYRNHLSTGTYDTQNGFEVRRLKFGIDGNVASPDFTYSFNLAVDRHTGAVSLEQAWASYRLHDSPFAFRAGQFKDPFDHEQLSSNRFLPVLDRSFINDVFANAEGYVKGVTAIYDPATFVRAEGGLTGGYKNSNTNFQPYPTNAANWGAAGRVEYKFFGNWKDYERVSAYGAARRSFVIGTGADYTEAGPTASLSHVIDAQYQSPRGLSLFAAYLGRYQRDVISKDTKIKRSVDTYDPTVRLQASYAVNVHWEPYGRFEYVHFNGREFAAGTQTNVEIITAGTNYYLFGQSARLTFDLSYLPNGSPVADDGFGILVNNRHNELIERAQLTLVF
jgi:hypothetical protein